IEEQEDGDSAASPGFLVWAHGGSPGPPEAASLHVAPRPDADARYPWALDSSRHPSREPSAAGSPIASNLSPDDRYRKQCGASTEPERAVCERSRTCRA